MLTLPDTTWKYSLILKCRIHATCTKIKAETFVILVADNPGEMHECILASFSVYRIALPSFHASNKS